MDRAEFRKNYARNPDSSGTGTPSGWLAIGASQAPSTLSYSTTQKHNGTMSLRADITGTGQYGKRMTTDGLTLGPGETIVWSFWVYSSKAGNMIPYWEGADYNAAYTGGSGGSSVSIPANTWTKVTGSYKASVSQPGVSSVIGVGGYGLNVVAGDVVYLDEFLIEKALTLGAYFDGTMSSASGKTYGWSGTANSSASIEYLSVPPLVAGSGTSSLLTTIMTDSSFGGWVQGREGSPFSIEFWALPLTVTGPSLLLAGHVNEGLFYDGSDYILRFEYAGAGIIEGRWREPEAKAHYFVITYDGSSGVLYVDGEAVIRLDLPRGDTFVASSAAINLNQRDGTGIYDSLAYYYRVITDAEVKEHFAQGRAVSSSVSIASSKGGTTWTLAYADVDVFQTITYDADSWDVGSFVDVSHTDRLEADAAGGTWQVAIPLGAMVSPATAGVHLRFVGEAVAMEWSTDAVTWQGIGNKTTVLEDAATTDLTLFVRLILISEDSWVESLAADLLGERVMQPFSGNRQLVFNNAEMDHEPGIQLEYQSDMGASITNGYVEVQLDNSDTPANISTIEFWAKFDGADGRLIDATGTNFVGITAGAFNITGFTGYRNGAAIAGSAATGQWDHYVFVSTSPLTGFIRLGDKLSGGAALKLSIGHLATYEKAFTVGEVTSLYSANIGAPSLRVDDIGGFSLSESATPYDIYAYAWSIVGGSN